LKSGGRCGIIKGMIEEKIVVILAHYFMDTKGEFD
jgi:hypothetical protein